MKVQVNHSEYAEADFLNATVYGTGDQLLTGHLDKQLFDLSLTAST